MSRLWGLVVVPLTLFLLGPTGHVKANLDHLDYEGLKHAFVSAIQIRFQKPVSLFNVIFDYLNTQRNLANTVEALQDGSNSYYFTSHSTTASKVADLVQMTKHDFVSFIRGEPKLNNLPPNIQCPGNIVVPQESGQRSALVTWTPPVGHDPEDGIIRNVELKTLNVAPGARFWSGVTPITYAVQDSQGRRAECSFSIEVKVISCQPPVFDVNKSKTCTSVVYLGETCTFACNTGYILSPNINKVTCTDTGTFFPSVPTCNIIGCKKPALPDGGESYSCSKGYSYSSVCTISCKRGFRVNGEGRPPWFEASMKCEASSQWTDTPICQDVSGPTFTTCPQTLRLYAERRSNATVAAWQKPEATDNSGFAPIIKQTGGPSNGDLLGVGPHLVKYEAEDASGNKEECMFFINVEVRKCHLPEQYHPRMLYNCDMEYIYGSVCNLSCSLGIEFQGSSEITCEVQNDRMNWRTPQGEPTCLEKDCIVPKPPTNGVLSCHDTSRGPRCSVMCKFEYVPARNVEPEGIIGCSPATGTWTYTEHPGCVKPKEPKGVQVAQMLYWKYPKCKEGDDMSNETKAMKEYLNQDFLFTGCLFGCKSVDVDAQCKLSNRNETFIMTTYKIWAPIFYNQTSLVALKKIDAAAAAHHQWFYDNFKTLNVRGTETNYYRARGKEQSVTCGEGLVGTGNLCVPCADGYKYEMGGCSLCPKDTYQNGADSLHCTPCPEGTFTVGEGSTYASNCKAPCKAGTYSATGLQSCWKCERGQYQEHPGSTQCNSCNIGDLTKSLGATSRESCYKPPDKVKDLSVTSTGETFLEAEWHEPTNTYSPLAGYVIDINKEGSEPTRPRIHVNENQTSFNITGLSPGTTYFIKVAAETTSGSGLAASVKTQTLQEKSTEENATVNACPAGTISPDGTITLLDECFDCSIGTYQPNTGQINCIPCNSTETTWYEGAKSIDACVDNSLARPTTTTTTTTTIPKVPCGANMISETGFEPGCSLCQAGRQVPNASRTICEWCPIVNGNLQCCE